MAYFDDNNELASGKGKDPIEELDDELEKILNQLGESGNDNAGDQADRREDPSVVRPTNPDKAHFDIEPSAETVRHKPEPPIPPKKHSKALMIITSVILCGLIVFGVALLVNRVLHTKLNSEYTGSQTVSTETFVDSELGTVTVKMVDGTALNTYDVNNLIKNDKGYYQYYEDDKVISEIGIDLAEYQGDVDFAAVKDSGVDYVILRIGGRYYSDEGKLYEDGRFDSYYEQAKAAGLKVGAYFFSQAITPDEAAEEARFVVDKLAGRSLDYPVAFDWEIIDDDVARTDNISGKALTEMAEQFCDIIEEKGYDSIVYSSTALMLQHYDFATMKDYDFWLADYREFPSMYYDFTMWQYATDGTVGGISNAVDLNICFRPYQ